MLMDEQIQELCANGNVVIERLLFVKDGYLYAKVLCWMPLDEGSTALNNCLIRPDRSIWGIGLTSNVGTLDCNARLIFTQKSFPLAVDSIEPATKWVQAQVDQACGVIKQVIADCVQVYQAIPQLETVVFNISEIA